jgi:tetratricopeptide (TPR) repeat protein
MTDWYRRKTWTTIDKEEFFAKLMRARKDSRAQYLKIQAIELVETKEAYLLTVAKELLTKMLDEYPDDNFNRPSALKALGDIYRLKSNVQQAISYYHQVLEHEAIYPNIQTNAYMSYAEVVVQYQRSDLYPDVENLIEAKLPSLLFPVEQYKANIILAIINQYYQRLHEAECFARQAKGYANLQQSGLTYHKNIGLVVEHEQWLNDLLS